MELTESRKLIITELIEEFKKSNTYSMYETDFIKFIDDESETRIITEILIYKLELITAPTKQTYRLTKKGIIFSSFENLESENSKVILNSFNNSTIGQFNQSGNLSVLKTEIKQEIHPTIKEKQQNVIISFILKFWWQILIPLLLGIVLIAIEKKWNIINIF